MRKSILIVGHGYFGGHLSARLPRESYRLAATTRNPEKANQLATVGIEPIRFDVVDPNAPEIRDRFDTVVYCIGYDRTQPATRHEVYVEGLKRFVSRLVHPPEKWIYISSTGVYGQSGGEWVDENSSTQPEREGGQVCLEAETVLRKSADINELVILRLAGIYGPQRLPNRAKLEQGQLTMNGEGYLNLIHVDDAAAITRWFIDQPATDQRRQLLYNVSDGNPPRRRDFYNLLAELLRVEPPVFVAKSADSLSRQDGSKRVANHALLEATAYRFLYPSYQQGLAAIVGES